MVVNAASTGIGTRNYSGGNYFDIGGLGSGTAYIKGYEAIVEMGNIYDGLFNLLTNNTARISISANGNVGIGTATPSQKLHVEGNLNVTGTIYATSFSGSNVMPSGMIAMFDGACPTGWTDNDGGTVTNLNANRYPRGAMSSIGATGGPNLPAHTHSYNDAWIASDSYSWTLAGGQIYGYHNYDVLRTTSSGGGLGDTSRLDPPYVNVRYCKKL